MEELNGVSNTLFLPLAARIFVSKKFPEYFFDEKSLVLENKFPYEVIEKASSEYFMIASAARYYNMDKKISEFANNYNLCNVVNLGCGFETAFSRLECIPARFYEVDLPEVIKKRRELLGESENDVLIGEDLFSLDWVEKLDTSLPTIAIASGVFMYFRKEKIIAFINELQKRFTNLEIVFDVTNEAGIKYANRYVKKSGNMDAEMYFYVNDGNLFAAELNDVRLIDESPFFEMARKILKHKVNLYSKMAMRFCDIKKRAMILHLKIC